MGRDLMTRPYGRFYNLAFHLSNSGHEVELFLFSYKKNEDSLISEDNLKIRSLSIFPNTISTLIRLQKHVKQIDPDWIMGFSDIYYGILADYLSRLNNKKSLIDAYDNYESYMSFAKPLHWLWRRSIKNADLITCAGPSLETLFRQYRKTAKINVLPMTVDENLFFEQSKEDSRNKLGLPLDMILVGYHGSIYETRDIETLFSAAELIKSKGKNNILFVLTGRKDKKVKIPEELLYLGYLSDIDIPIFINSLDVLVVTNKRSKFGDYSYPVKLYEALSCNVPVIVSKTKSTEWIMRNHPELLVEASNASALSEKIEEVINIEGVVYEKLLSWKDIAYQLSHLIETN